MGEESDIFHVVPKSKTRIQEWELKETYLTPWEDKKLIKY